MLRSIFGEQVDLDRVILDEKAFLGPKQYKFAYVAFNCVNSYGKLSSKVLVHEVVHIWQFQNFGSIYLYEALKAQRSIEKYDYGGLPALYKAMNQGKQLLDYNFEQQGDIVEDYYKLRFLASKEIDKFALGVYSYFVENQFELEDPTYSSVKYQTRNT